MNYGMREIPKKPQISYISVQNSLDRTMQTCSNQKGGPGAQTSDRTSTSECLDPELASSSNSTQKIPVSMPLVKWMLGFLAEGQKSQDEGGRKNSGIEWRKTVKRCLGKGIWKFEICKVQNKRRDAGGNVMVWRCTGAGEREISIGIKEQWTKNAFAPVCYWMLHPGTRMEPISSYQRTMLWELLDPVVGNKWSSSQSNYCEALQEIWRNKFPDNSNKELKSARL